MNFLELATLLLFLASVFSIVNLRILKLPHTIGLMVLAIALSMVILIIGLVFPDFLSFATSLTQEFDFSVLLIDVMLPFLLFAGAISVDVHELLKDYHITTSNFWSIVLHLCSGNWSFLAYQSTLFGDGIPWTDLRGLPTLWFACSTN